MNRNDVQILVLVEGARTDVRLMEHLLKVYNLNKKHKIVSYNTNIYVLYDEMFKNNNPREMDLLQLLKSKEKNLEKKKIFEQNYSDILLIFDFDPQDDRFKEAHIMEMLNYFTESSDMGKLYINYPMVEAFYHMKSIPDPEFNTYEVSLEELKQGGYKSRVNRENRNGNYSKFAVTREECNTVIRQNRDKAFNIIRETKDLADTVLPDSKKVLQLQIERLKTAKKVAVLCTCGFYILDYNPKLISKPVS